MNESKAIEILKTALLLEKRGKAFYTKVANQAADPDVKYPSKGKGSGLSF